MNHYYLKEHDKSCYRDICSVKSNVIYLRGDFYLVSYNGCFIYNERLWFKNLIKNTLKAKEIDKYEVESGWGLDSELHEFRLRDKAIRNKIHEVNFTYVDATRKIYGIVTTINYMDAVVNQDQIRENFKIFISGLEKNGYKTLIDEARYLLDYNTFHTDEAEIIKTVDILIKKINNHANCKKSKFKTTS